MSSEVMKILMDYSERSGKRDYGLRTLSSYQYHQELDKKTLKKKKKTKSKIGAKYKRYR